MNQKTVSTAGLCPVVEGAFTLVGKKWTGLIIHVLGKGPYRFSEILREIADISPRILTQRLKELEGEDIVHREVIPETPVRVQYSLTDKGQQLIPLMQGVAEWAHRWADKS